MSAIPRKPAVKPAKTAHDFTALVEAVRRIHNECAVAINRTVNTTLTLRNWLIGGYIRDYEQHGADRAQYGIHLLEKLSDSLQGCLDRCYTGRYLGLCRQLFDAYPSIRKSLISESGVALLPGISEPSVARSKTRKSVISEFGADSWTLIQRLSFTHLVELLALEDPLKRAFYEIECIRGNWSVRALKRQIATLYFERSGLSLDKEKLADMAHSAAEKAEPKLAIRDPYIFEFLGLKASEVVSESNLQAALLDNLHEFLMELGHGFCLEARQKSIVIGKTRGFVDLVFYHRILKCHVLIELKVDKFTGQQTCRSLPAEEGTVYLFADGLRMDLARALEEKLICSGLEVRLDYEWSALPTVTATGKHAWMPLAGKLSGPLEGEGFEPKEQSTGKTITHARFKQLIEELGISFLITDGTLFPTGCAWTEFGSLDTYGHDQGAKLAWRAEEELAGLQQRILDLIHIGWSKVKVITDHGWLLLPGGLPKTELPKHLAESRWGRCAIPSAGAQHGYPMTSWFWDTAEAVVLAPGVSCFIAGMEYAHGGLTLQEALIPSLTISTKEGGTKSVVLKEMKWSGMRLNIILEGAAGLAVDLRSKVADASTSIATSTMTAAEDGQKTSLLVADDETLGAAAFLVVMDESGQPIFKHSIVIGEN